jgi:hypothetical protein
VGRCWILLAAAVALEAWAADAVTLAPKWKVGERRVHRMSQHQDQDITAAAMPQPMKQVTRHQQEFSVTATKAREGGGFELDVEYLQMQMKSQMGEQTVLSFDSQSDSKDDSSNPVAPMLRALAGAKFRLLTRADGQVEKVEGVQEFVGKLSASAPPMLAGMLQQLVNEDTVKQMGVTTAGLPQKPVKVGDQWPYQQEFSLGPLGTLIVKLDVTFKGWEEHAGRKCAVLEHTGTIGRKEAEAADSSMLRSMTGDTKGKTWFDPEAGAEVESIAFQNMLMKLDAMGQEASVNMKQSITNQLIDLKR